MTKTESQGVHGTGPTTYTDEQMARVVRYVAVFSLIHMQRTVQQIHKETGLSGNTIRKILSDGDGVYFLLGGNGIGYIFAPTAQGGEQLTARLESQVSKMQQRIARRKKYASSMHQSE